jgi:translation initiation factor IF-3
LIDEDGKQVSVVDIDEARRLSREAGLDLVEIAPKANPPVVRIIDFKKFKYEESKRERTSKKKPKEPDTKEIWLGPLISEHDLKVRTEQAKVFVTNGDRVKLTVKFGGREIVHPEFGYEVLEKVVLALSDCAEKDSKPRLVGRNLSLSLKPKKK